LSEGGVRGGDEITLLYFAWVRERIGAARATMVLAEPLTLGELVEQLRREGPGHAEALEDMTRLRGAINQEFVGWDAWVRPGDEVALFPPVTGG
jgi:molybdopterin converting factor subunit 1